MSDYPDTYPIGEPPEDPIEPGPFDDEPYVIEDGVVVWRSA